MKQRIELTLERISSLAKEMPDQDENDRARTYATIKVLLDWLFEANREYNHDNGYAREKLTSIEWGAACLAGFEGSSQRDDLDRLSWLYGDIESAGSELALGAIDLE